MNSSLVIKPLTTEKALHMAKEGKYGFLVRNEASKLAIKQLVESLYGVKVSKINSLREHPKMRLSKGGGQTIKRHAFKKIIVTLKGKKTIDVYSVKDKK